MDIVEGKKYFKLNDNDLKILLEGKMLNDNHIYKFQELLEIESGGIMQMQIAGYLQMLDEIIPIHKNRKHIQILFSGSNDLGHWICTYYDTNQLFVYDSLNKKYLNEDERNFVNRLYPFKLTEVFPTVQQQPNCVDCGIYAIAFATSIYCNVMPETVLYNHAVMRGHLYTMFQNNYLSHFPIVSSNSKKFENIKVVATKRKHLNNEFYEENDKNRIKALKDKERKKKARLVETKEQTIDRKNEDKERKRKYIAEETDNEKKKRKERNVACKKKKLLLEIESEKKERQDKDLARKRKNKNYNQKLKSIGIAIMCFEQINENEITQNYLGSMDVKCVFCDSLNFLCEKPKDGKFSSCCHKGKVKLDNLNVYPIYLRNLLSNSNMENKNYKENIRFYNSSLAFASMGAKLEVPKGYGPYVYRIHGQVYHNTYSLHPKDDDKRKYGQLYIIDTNEALQERLSNEYNKKCLPSLMSEIDNLLRNINPYAKAFKMMREVELEEEARAKLLNKPIRNIEMWIKRDRSLDQKKFNIPSCNEVAVVFVSENGEPPMDRDICIHPKDSKSIPISSLSANADPMTYPLMFPSGDPGWTVNIKHQQGDRKVTPLQFYVYRLSYRGDFNPCLSLGKLTQQYVVDVWSKVEGERLKYIRQQQKKLRAEMYCGLMDYINHKAKEDNVRPGKMIILPSTFTGGPRSYQQSFMDAMRLVQELGKPDLFITMTCNPKWSEIIDNLLNGQTSSDRPDIVARVFQQKVQVLMIELKEKQIFGAIIGYIYI